MVKQIVIAAGGTGSRMSQNMNPLKCKALIEYEGFPLIYYLLSSAKESGIEEFFISITEPYIKLMEDLADNLKIKSKILSPSPNGFEGVPSLFKNDLDERVLVACGHQFIPREHFISLIEYSKKFTAVYTAYQEPVHKIRDQPRRTLIHNLNDPENLRFEKVDLREMIIPNEFFYTRNPYIITREMVGEVEDNKFRSTVGMFIYEHWKKEGKVSAVKSIMPPEFDYDDELERTKKYMNEYFNQ